MLARAKLRRLMRTRGNDARFPCRDLARIESLLDELPNTVVSGAVAVVGDFLRKRGLGDVPPDTLLVDVFDSLLFLDFFLHLEGVYGEAISLDEVAQSPTFEALTQLLDGMEVAAGISGAV